MRSDSCTVDVRGGGNRRRRRPSRPISAQPEDLCAPPLAAAMFVLFILLIESLLYSPNPPAALGVFGSFLKEGRVSRRDLGGHPRVERGWSDAPPHPSTHVYHSRIRVSRVIPDLTEAHEPGLAYLHICNPDSSHDTFEFRCLLQMDMIDDTSKMQRQPGPTRSPPG